MSQKKCVLFTGGGTAGHVTPNLALIPLCRERGYEVAYIGSHDGIERQLVSAREIPYYPISTGKLRRYLSWQNLTDIFKVALGTWQALLTCFRLKPALVFSKGGFVSVPVILAATLRRIPIIAHESDLSPGLATKIAYRFAKKLCVSFEKTQAAFPKSPNVVYTGTPFRSALFEGDAEKGQQFCGFAVRRPTILFTGGGLGAGSINLWVHQHLVHLLPDFNVIHLCGRGHLVDRVLAGYAQFEYVDDAFPDLMALADLVVSRAGANAVMELLVLRKPHILIPLPARVSRGDQLENARHFEELGMSVVVTDEHMSDELLDQIKALAGKLPQKREQLESLALPSANQTLLELIESVLST